MSKKKILFYRTKKQDNEPISLEKGEIALNINPQSPLIYFKDDEDKIQKISSLLDNKYTAVEYPKLDNVIFDKNQSGTTISDSIHNVDSNIATLANEVIKNELTVATSITNIKENVGLDSDLSYKPNPSSERISGTTVMSDAVNLIDEDLAIVEKNVERNETVVSKAITDIQVNTGLNSDLTYKPNSSSKRISGATNIIDAINLLDTSMNDSATKTDLSSKQDKLVGTQIEGQNIKTINGETLLGSGNIEIVSGGGGGAVDSVNGKTGVVTITAEDLKVYTKAEIDGKNYATKGEIPSLVGYATEAWVGEQKFLKEIPTEYVTDKELIAKDYATKSELPSLDGYAKENTVNDALALKADKTAISDMATKTWVNGEKFLKEVPAEYVTDIELTQKGYLTEHQDISGKLDITAATATYATKENLKEKANTSDIADMATQTWVNGENFLKEVPAEYVTDEELNLKNYATVDQLPNIKGKLDTTVYEQDKQTFALKSDLTSKQDSLVSGTNIKTINSQDITGSGNIEIKGGVESVNGKTGAVTITAKDLGALTSIPTEYVTETELIQKGYLTEHQDISGKLDTTAATNTYATKEELNGKANASEISDMATKAWVGEQGYLTEHQDISGKLDTTVYEKDKPTFATKDELPSLAGYAKESWVEGKNYLTAIPENYVTEEELTAKNYATVSQLPDISGKLDTIAATNTYATKEELTNKGNDIESNAAKTYATKEELNAYIASYLPFERITQSEYDRKLSAGELDNKKLYCIIG